MRTELRKKHPYYGKYRYKLDVGVFYTTQPAGWTKAKERKETLEFIDYIKKNIKEENYLMVFNSWSRWPVVYIANKDEVEIVIKSRFKIYIWCFTKPAPGYENKKKPNKDEITSLWYNRYPYKIVLRLDDNIEIEETLEWCEENISRNYTKSGYMGNISYFFINSIDAMAFKLRFSDNVKDTKITDDKTAKRWLKDRIRRAEEDLKTFLEGV